MFTSKAYHQYGEVINKALRENGDMDGIAPPSDLKSESDFIYVAIAVLETNIELLKEFNRENNKKKEKIRELRALTSGLTKEQILEALNLSNNG